jgi:hypothetical protein
MGAPVVFRKAIETGRERAHEVRLDRLDAARLDAAAKA